ncbi:unnamed protein product [Rotaria sp. Silwood1]|nr:unnamed protein product [Rotaria sp. Silwood1]
MMFCHQLMEHEMKLLVVASHLFVCEGIHLDESGLVLRLAQLIIYDRIEMMLTLDQQTLNKQLLPKYLPLIL